MHADQNPNAAAPDALTLGDWDHCAAGEVKRMVSRLNFAERCAKRNRYYFCGALAMMLVAGVVVLGGMLMTQSMPKYGGLTCAECRSHFGVYHDHLTGQVKMDNADLAKGMKAHLTQCEPCQSKFNSIYPGLLAHTRSHSVSRIFSTLAMAPFSLHSNRAGL